MSGLKHGFTAEVVERDENQRATLWVGRCGRHESFAGPSYEYVEDKWREHVHATTGKVPLPLGDKANRWQPERAAS